MTDSTDVSQTSQIETEWSRLSLVSVIYYLFSIAKQIATNALPSLAPLMVVILSADNKGRMIVLIGIAAIVLLLVTSFLQYWFFRFRLMGDEIQINQGVFKKERRVISFTRVQNINIQQPFYFKPFKLVVLTVDTAGSSSGEGALAGILQDKAQQIRDLVLLKQSQNETQNEVSTQQSSDEQSSDATIIASASIGDLVRYGLSNNSAYFILALMAPFFKTIEQYISDMVSEGKFQPWFNLFNDQATAVTVLVIVMILSVMVLLSTISVLGAIFQYYRYQLTMDNKTLKRRSGLINTHEESLNLHKIQALVRRANFIACWFKRENFILRQTNSSSPNAQAQGKRQSLFIVPARTKQQSEQLVATLYPDHSEITPLYPISKRYILKTWLVNVSIPVALIPIPFVLSNVPNAHYLWFLPIVFLPLVYLRWRKYRYGLGEQFGLIKTGFFGYKQVLFPLFKVQHASISQSYLQKRNSLATLTIYLASGPLKIPYMPIEHARLWFDNIYHRIETDQRPWF